MSGRKVVRIVAAVVVGALLAAGCSSGAKHPAAAARSSSATVKPTTTTAAPPAGSAGSTTTTGGSTAAPPTTKAPAGGSATQAEFVSEANSICKTTNAKTRAVGAALPKDPTAADQAAAIDKGADIIQAGIAQMQRLTQPSGDRSQLILFYQRSQQLIVLTHKLAAAFRANDPPLVSSIETQGDALDNDLTHAADGYGLTACGSGSGP